MKWTSWASCAHGRCLAKSPFENNSLLLQKQKVAVLELIGQRVAAWYCSSCGEELGTLALSLSSSGSRAGSFWGKPEQDLACWEVSPPAPPSVSLLWISCKWSQNWMNKPNTCLLVLVQPCLAKTPLKKPRLEADAVWHRTVGQALCKRLSPHIRKCGIALSSLEKCKENQILKSQRNSSFWNLIFNTYSAWKVSVIVGVCARQVYGATKERNTLFQSEVLLHGTPDPFSCILKRCPGTVGHLSQWKRYSLHHFTSSRYCLSWMRGGKANEFTNTTQKKEAALKKI